MKLDVLLINPGTRSDVYQGLGAEFSAIEPPSLAAMFATYLRMKGQSVAIIDAPAMNLSPIEVAEQCRGLDPTLIVMVVYGFQPSASTQNMTAAGETCRQIKQLMPNARILMTGTHPAALPQRTLEEEAVDFVCDGEGPHAIKVTSEYCAWHSNKISPMILTGLPISNLNEEMPSAAWDLLPMEKYRAHNWHALDDLDNRSPYASIHTSLGCPYKCNFCCINAPFGGPSYRMWSPPIVGHEIERLVNNYGIRHLKFVDEMFVLNRAHVIGVCDEIIRRGLGPHLNIWAYARIDTVKDEYLTKLREAGFRWLALGIESGSKHVRDGADKNLRSEDIIGTVRRIQAAGINVIGNYIFGLPDDTHETMYATLDLALEANCEFANFYSAMAYPGSKLYPMALEKGWKLPDKWIGYSQHSYETEPLPTETLTGAEVLRFRDQAFKAYFTNESYLLAVRAKFGQAGLDHIGRMVAQPLPRKLLA